MTEVQYQQNYLVLLKILLKRSPKCDQSVCQWAGIMHNQGRSWGTNRVNPLHDPAAIWVPVLVTRRLHAGGTLGLIELWHVSLVMVEELQDVQRSLCFVCLWHCERWFCEWFNIFKVLSMVTEVKTDWMHNFPVKSNLKVQLSAPSYHH